MQPLHYMITDSGFARSSTTCICQRTVSGVTTTCYTLLVMLRSPATPMKKGICLPKLALALDGEAGVPREVLETSVRLTDASVLILSPINLLTSEAARWL